MLTPQVLDLNIIVADMEKMLPRLVGEYVDLAIPPLEQVKAVPSQLDQNRLTGIGHLHT